MLVKLWLPQPNSVEKRVTQTLWISQMIISVLIIVTVSQDGQLQHLIITPAVRKCLQRHFILHLNLDPIAYAEHF